MYIYNSNGLITNFSRSHFFLSAYEKKALQMYNAHIESTCFGELLETKIDSEYAIRGQIMSLGSKGDRKFSALAE